MSLKVIGSGTPARIVTGWSKSGGDYTDYTWRGEKQNMQAKYASLRGICDDIEITEEGLLWEVHARFNRVPFESGDEEPQDEVRLSANRVAKDIREHEAFTELDQDEMEWLNAYINGDKDDQETALDYIVASAAVWPVDAYNIFINDITKGVRHFIVYQPTLTLVRVASSLYQFSVNYANIGKVYSTPRLQGEQGIGDLIRVTLPNETPADPTQYIYGWQKHYPEYQPGSNGKYVFTQEYEYGKFSRNIYDVIE